MLAYLTTISERLPRPVAALISEGGPALCLVHGSFLSTAAQISLPHQADVILRPTSVGMTKKNFFGVHNLTYIDDFIFVAASKHECEEAVRKFKALCADWGVVLKEEKDAAPAQKMTALGIEYDLIKFTRRITEKCRLEIQANLKLATESRTGDCGKT